MGSGDMLVPGVLVSIVMVVVGALLKRAIDANDRTQREMKDAFTAGLASLATELRGLAASHSAHAESIVELRVRLTTAERDLLQVQNRVQRRRSTDEEGA